ncbi:helix-turn-helix domain-containing protein [Streptococcus pasteurianus]|uniref:helix-turn-helix domain-containing protein n=1 Tax=Streptococcus pasteurianus TaxID=197614 RepID=UPI0009E319AB|nr:helix-turn-helix transcriptional regulator [Streptococcus pasteurianus]QBX27741.1 DNA-binding protein [Streptococcus phage Javan414]
MTRLRELQRAKKLTQQELAEIAGVSKRTIQNWEDGTSNIKPEKAKKLADHFGVSVGYLLGYDNDFEKQIRIDTLNNLIYKMHTAYVSLLEKTDKEAFWAGFEAAELIVQMQKMILEFEESANGK